MPSTESHHVHKTRVGKVVSDNMSKTIVVEVERHIRHRLYGKEMRRKARFHAHDEKEIAKVGDRVKIMETRPLSKTKCWRLVEVIAHKD